MRGLPNVTVVVYVTLMSYADAVGDQPDPRGDGAVGPADRTVAAALLLLLLYAGASRRVHPVRLVLRLPLPDGVPADHLSYGVHLAHRRTCRAQVDRLT